MRSTRPRTVQVQLRLTDPRPPVAGLAHRERCSVPPAVLRALHPAAYQDFLTDRKRRFQVLLCARDHSAVFSVADDPPGDDQLPVVRVSRGGLRRLSLPEADLARGIQATIQPGVLGEHFSEQLDHGEQPFLIVAAPHGGAIERRTDEQARAVADQLRLAGLSASLWTCRGRSTPGRSDAYARWHITSTDLSPWSFPQLGQLLLPATRPPFEHALSLHGFSRPDRHGACVVIGGGGDGTLKEALRDAIARAVAPFTPREVRIAGPGEAYAGLQRRNVVNRLGRHGIQIEQCAAVRRTPESAMSVARAVAEVYARLARHELRR